MTPTVRRGGKLSRVLGRSREGHNLSHLGSGSWMGHCAMTEGVASAGAATTALSPSCTLSSRSFPVHSVQSGKQSISDRQGSLPLLLNTGRDDKGIQPLKSECTGKSSTLASCDERKQAEGVTK